jgi:hypothetical protein
MLTMVLLVMSDTECTRHWFDDGAVGYGTNR